MSCIDLKNNAGRKSSNSFWSKLLLSIAVVAIVMLFLSVDVNKVLGLADYGPAPLYSEILGRIVR